MRTNATPSSCLPVSSIPVRANRPWSRRTLITSLVVTPALLAMTACSGAAPTPPTQPTVQAAATQVVGAASPAAATMQAVASPAAATMQAVASPALATAQAAASPIATSGAAVVATAAAGIAPMASPSPSPSPAAVISRSQGIGALRIADASMADATPWVSIQNSSDEPISVGGWTLQVGEATAPLPPDAVVPPGAALTLHAGAGLSSEDELFLGNAGDALAAAALPGTPVRLTDASGAVHAETTVPRF